MSGKTDGQLAYEAFYTAFGGTVPDWPPIGMEGGREAWEAAAAAGADSARERMAELVSEVGELRALHKEAHVALDNMLAQRDQLERESRAARNECDQLRVMLSTLTDRAEASGTITEDEADEYRDRAGLKAWQTANAAAVLAGPDALGDLQAAIPDRDG
jgi:hypothetical protein